MSDTATRPRSRPGRPREYDEAAALSAALQVFWTRGYEATTLDDLTGAMGLSRSSFYSAFGSKEQVFLAALSAYSEDALSALSEIAHRPEGEPVDAMLAALADPQGGPRGCLLVNCITELAPHNDRVAAIGRRHIDRIEQLFAEALSPSDPAAAIDRARALAALAIGTVTLRKSGLSPDAISAALAQGRALFASPQ
ncbi:TetR/AcrR family transcriptional regulator [Amorphus orientalis]|uniref:TetR/AcrR family transcriptional repressor of nem operon n=1 Tax=Amorphus orientalis TaxID=649198 RepID=A0AAE3VS96_9HYPH|nr:TetR/AcrR family transcriptional regulator [Amorphus orientalis]MDQ0317243.1 TetR/AcrR family transcriptional repressor of nem operon [Amorphus orientalis]